MPLAPDLLVRTLVRPGGRLTTVVVRRRRRVAPTAPKPTEEPRVLQSPTEGEPVCRDKVPSDRGARERFSQPVARALAVLGARVRPVGREDVALDGRRAPLRRVVAEANRCLAAAGRPGIAYPGIAHQGFPAREGG